MFQSKHVYLPVHVLQQDMQSVDRHAAALDQVLLSKSMLIHMSDVPN